MADEKLNLKDHSVASLRRIFGERGLEPFRGSQVFRWIWRRRATSVADMTDLPLALRKELEENATIPELAISHAHVARDGTTKLLAMLPDGLEVEAVIIPDDRRAEARESDPDFDASDDGEPREGPKLGRRTLCISTQVGCAMGCT